MFKQKLTVLSAVLYCALYTVNCSFANTNDKSNSQVSIGRYLSLPAQANAAQQHLLSQQVQVKFPASVISIDDAVKFLLQFSGYHLTDKHSQAVKAMLAQPLPMVDRNLSPMPLQQALKTLAGESFYLLVDPVHRLIDYKLRKNYQLLYSGT